VPVRHTKAARNPTGNLVFVVETDPRPTPYNSGIPWDSWLEYWLGCVSRATDLVKGQAGFEFFFMVEIGSCPPHKIFQDFSAIPT